MTRSNRLVGRRTLLAAAGASMLPAPAVLAQNAGGGVALVIGNSKYQWEASLPNVKRDAPDVAKCFQAMGLKTELVQDAGRAAMIQAVGKFKASARGADFAALYFAGHGANWEKDTYLVPVDADLSDPKAVQGLVLVNDIHQGMGRAAHRMMVYDNCRNNPADGWQQLAAQRAAAINLEKQEAAGRSPLPNTLTLFSTSPGRIALDGPPGENSPFCAALLRELSQPADLQSLPAKLRRDLLIATKGRQVLWDVDTYHQPYMLKAGGAAAAARTTSWTVDPSRIIELPNVYAYAQQNGLPLPQGLIAHRPPSTSPKDVMKVGSFKFTAVGPRGPYPGLIIVMSIEGGKTAEIIMAGNRQGPFWRFVTADVSGDTIEYQPRDQGGTFTFHWKDANGGNLTLMQAQAGKRGPGASTAHRSDSFTRLDG